MAWINRNEPADSHPGRSSPLPRGYTRIQDLMGAPAPSQPESKRIHSKYDYSPKFWFIKVFTLHKYLFFCAQ